MITNQPTLPSRVVLNLKMKVKIRLWDKKKHEIGKYNIVYQYADVTKANLGYYLSDESAPTSTIV